MKKTLKEVQDGIFAHKRINKAKSGGKGFNAMSEKDKSLPVEVVGEKLHKPMNFNAKEVD